jgi:hypothetical protein
MSMNITFYKKGSLDSYSLSPAADRNKDSIWLTDHHAEGRDFPADEIADVIFNALDKYFREKY